MRILIPGIAGALARRVAKRFHAKGHEVIGIDARPWSDAPKGIELHGVDIRKRQAEDVFRTRKPEVVLHMATVSALTASGEERHRINLGGTRALFDLCKAHGVKHAIFVGRHTYYGAGPDSPLYHTEDEPPQALAHYPELADLVAADLYACTALWRIPKLNTAVLRLTYTLGPTGQGTLAGFLKGRRVPMILGFDPLFHFLHEDDAVTALELAVEKRLRGVFNVAGPNPLPLSVIARETGRAPVPLPEALARFALGKFGLPALPPGALEHIKYPIVVDAAPFRAATGFAHEHDEVATLRAYAEAFPPPGR